MFKKAVALALAVTALGLVATGSAAADKEAHGNIEQGEYISSPPGAVWKYHKLGAFKFKPRGEKVVVDDQVKNGWSILVELWWGGKLRRVCWDSTLGGVYRGNRAHTCNFKIPDGRRITFFIAEARKRTWKRCWRRGKTAWYAPSGPCGKNPGIWWGPNRRIPDNPADYDGFVGYGDYRGRA
jgi:hypothetical protein